MYRRTLLGLNDELPPAGGIAPHAGYRIPGPLEIAATHVTRGSNVHPQGAALEGFNVAPASIPFTLGEDAYCLRTTDDQLHVNSSEEIVPPPEARAVIERAALVHKENMPLRHLLAKAASKRSGSHQPKTVILVRKRSKRPPAGGTTSAPLPASTLLPQLKPKPKPTAPSPCATDFVLSTCRIVKGKDSLQIAASESGGASAGAYEWTTSSAKITLGNSTSSTVTVTALDQASASRDAETITVTRKQDGCPPVVKVVKVTVAKVTFSAAASQRFGHDNFDTPADPLDDHICIKKSDYTFLHVKIEGGAVGTDFDFICDDATVCTPLPPPATAEFDLRLNAAAENKKDTDLHAKVKCPAATSFTHIRVHVYKEREVDVVVAKFDKTKTGANLRFPTADYAAHSTPANAKLKEAVVKYNITNYDPANAVTPVNLVGGGATVTYDINGGGGADLTAIGAAMTGTGTKVRVAIIRDMKSVYILSAAAAAGDTTLVVTAGSTFFHVGDTPPLGTGATRETIKITALAGNTITCAKLTKAHRAGEMIEFPAAGWSSDPILIIEGSATLDVTKWTVLHEVGHRALELADIIDPTDFMHFSQSWTDYRLRYCPRKKNYPAGTTNTENQWETIPRK